MANARLIVKRRKAVKNIRKITSTMQLIATARFQQAFQRAVATKPYTKKITELVGQLSRAGAQIDHPLMQENPEAPVEMLWVLASNRGLCGAYNSNVLQKSMRYVNELGDKPVELNCVGKKGIAFFKFMKRKLTRSVTNIDDRPRFEQVEPLAEEMMAAYEEGRVSKVSVAYMRFISTGRQVAEITQILPITQLTGAEQNAGDPVAEQGGQVEYDFSPEPDVLIKALVPQTVKVRLYQCFTDAAVSEQVARMVAMKSATDAADDMIKSLSRSYNRARQTQITMQLLDIVGGANALA